MFLWKECKPVRGPSLVASDVDVWRLVGGVDGPLTLSDGRSEWVRDNE
jgi:hypothetical protein